MRTKIITIAIGGTLLAACAGNPNTGTGPRENTGTLLGATAGAVVGSQVGGGAGERVAGAVAGGVIGGLLGNRIGAALDEEDRRRAEAAQMEALERGRSGVPVAWRSPDSGRYGNVVPGQAYQREGRDCRPYTHTVYVDGRPETMQGDACRLDDGTWQAV